MPLGLDYPYWVDDQDFDLDYHVRELALARPGSDKQLAAQVARIIARPLDRARPLWELYRIHGLRSGHTAMLTKIHHAVVDGLSGAEIMGLLLDLTPEGRELPPPRTGPTGAGAPRRRRELGDARPRAARRPALPAARRAVAPRRCRTSPTTTLFGTIPGAGTVGRSPARADASAARARPRAA